MSNFVYFTHVFQHCCLHLFGFLFDDFFFGDFFGALFDATTHCLFFGIFWVHFLMESQKTLSFFLCYFRIIFLSPLSVSLFAVQSGLKRKNEKRDDDNFSLFLFFSLFSSLDRRAAAARGGREAVKQQQRT